MEDGLDRDAPELLFDAIRSMFLELHLALERGETLRPGATPTGVEAFDRAIGGFMPGEVVAISGPRASGKTTLACQLAAGVARAGARPQEPPRAGVLYVTSHARAADIALRIVCGRADIEIARARAGDLAGEDWDRYTAVADEMAQLPLWIDDRPADSPDERVARIRTHASTEYRPDGILRFALLVIDDAPGDRRAFDWLRALATELGCAALAVVESDGKAAPERCGADMHVALCRVDQDVRPVLVHARHALTRPMAMRWPVGRSTSMEEDSGGPRFEDDEDE